MSNMYSVLDVSSPKQSPTDFGTQIEVEHIHLKNDQEQEQEQKQEQKQKQEQEQEQEQDGDCEKQSALTLPPIDALTLEGVQKHTQEYKYDDCRFDGLSPEEMRRISKHDLDYVRHIETSYTSLKGKKAPRSIDRKGDFVIYQTEETMDFIHDKTKKAYNEMPIEQKERTLCPTEFKKSACAFGSQHCHYAHLHPRARPCFTYGLQGRCVTERSRPCRYVHILFPMCKNEHCFNRDSGGFYCKSCYNKYRHQQKESSSSSSPSSS